MAADGCCAEPSREQRLAEARGLIKVPLPFHQDRCWTRFLEGCPANHAVLSTGQFGRLPKAGSMALSTPAASYVRSACEPDRSPTQEPCDFIHRSIDGIRLGPCVACLSHAISRRVAGGRPDRGVGDSGFDHHSGAERAGPERRVAAGVGAAGRDRRRLARRRIGILGRASRPARDPRVPGRCRSYPRVVAQSEAFFRRWGTLAVFFARFVPPIRAFVPITAGALGMTPLRFYAVNIPAILLWAPAHVLPGVLAISAAGTLRHFVGAGAGAKHYWMPLVVGGALIRRAGGLDHPPPEWRRRDRAGARNSRADRRPARFECAR